VLIRVIDITGSFINLKSDPDIFNETTEYDYDILKNRLRELAFLNRKLTITLEDDRDEERENVEFYYEGGIQSYVEFMNRTKEVLHEPIYAEGEAKNNEAEIALQYNDGFQNNLFSLANNIITYE